MGLDIVLKATIYGLFFSGLCLTRFFVTPGLVDRPITISLFFGLITNSWEYSLGLGIFFELFWLDLFPAGTFIPPHRIFPLFLNLTICHELKPSGVDFYILLLLTLPFAFIGSYLERVHRIFQNKDYENIIHCINTNERYSLSPKILRSLFQLFSMNMAIFWSSFLVLFYILISIGDRLKGNSSIHISWPFIWAISLIGGVLSLRVKKNYIILITGFIGMAVVLLFIK